ncbi:Calcineurin-like metallo-phosphoesterase superfamily protein [Actinidia rufa]|uniref:Calcineurin-like metallo-phosphoesterase superfamily protein n=1 Tax=Actinidia rufa TaxID=165716 RepID=A0A7J0GKL0_9ERIC|nr:Calcineurin-like metallo-phosphoesterase superfamily protein [Actinidia rufa]
MGMVLLVLSLCFLSTSTLSYPATEEIPKSNLLNENEIIEVKGGPEDVVWLVQLSDLHFSVHHPERTRHFKDIVGPSLSMINPSLVLIHWRSHRGLRGWWKNVRSIRIRAAEGKDGFGFSFRGREDRVTDMAFAI